MLKRAENDEVKIDQSRAYLLKVKEKEVKNK